jgi:hypothetical protein
MVARFLFQVRASVAAGWPFPQQRKAQRPAPALVRALASVALRWLVHRYAPTPQLKLLIFGVVTRRDVCRLSLRCHASLRRHEGDRAGSAIGRERRPL